MVQTLICLMVGMIVARAGVIQFTLVLLIEGRPFGHFSSGQISAEIFMNQRRMVLALQQKSGIEF